MTKKIKKPAKLPKEICKNPPGSHKTCPVFLTLELIANKWSVQLLNHLLHASDHTLRFNQLQKVLVGISHRELAKQLREFEKSGIVVRTVYPQIPPKVEYTLTDIGESLFEPIDALSAWAVENGEKVQKKRVEFEKKHKA